MAEQVNNDEQLLNSLKVLVSEACKTGNIESQLDSESITVKLRFSRGTGGDLDFARRVAALLAQETM
jgi:hypothetical protein